MIFLFNFTIVLNGIDFVLNKHLATDMSTYGVDYENDYIKHEVIFENAKLIAEILIKVMNRACRVHRSSLGTDDGGGMRP